MMIRIQSGGKRLVNIPGRWSRMCKDEEKLWCVYGNERRPVNQSKGERERTAQEEIGKEGATDHMESSSYIKGLKLYYKCNVFESSVVIITASFWS